MLVSELCDRVRPELAAFGELGGRLLVALDAVAVVAGLRSVDLLDDPAFALELLTAPREGTEPAVLGRVLDHLRAEASGAGTAGTNKRAGGITVADAIDEYEKGPLLLLAESSQTNFRTWTRRLRARFGDRPVASLTAGDLTDLISGHVARAQDDHRTKRSGKGSVEMAVAVYRNVWRYLCQKRYATENVAMELRKPARSDADRRAVRRDEAALLRAVARTGRDPLLDQVILALPERAALRSIESCRAAIRDADLSNDLLRVRRGKGDKTRTIPITPGLHDLLVRYLEDRRPADVAFDEWCQSEEPLLRTRPSVQAPRGRAVGRGRIGNLSARLRSAAPEVFAGDDVSLHSFRHAVARWMDERYGRGHVRAVLGHQAESPSDHYTKVSPEELREPLAEYEAWLLDAETPL